MVNECMYSIKQHEHARETLRVMQVAVNRAKWRLHVISELINIVSTFELNSAQAAALLSVTESLRVEVDSALTDGGVHAV